jgi:hypothetical protein
MEQYDFDAIAYLELLPSGENGFIVWLFDHQIGEGDTVEEAIADARDNIRRWTEEP